MPVFIFAQPAKMEFKHIKNENGLSNSPLRQFFRTAG
jgi:hypothetical protein